MFLHEHTTEQVTQVLAYFMKWCKYGVCITDTGFAQVDSTNVLGLLSSDCIYWE